MGVKHLIFASLIVYVSELVSVQLCISKSYKICNNYVSIMYLCDHVKLSAQSNCLDLTKRENIKSKLDN